MRQLCHAESMSTPHIVPPPSGYTLPSLRISDCGEALAPRLSALSRGTQAAGRGEHEVTIAVMTWAATRATIIDGGEAVTQAMMLSLDAARSQGG